MNAEVKAYNQSVLDGLTAQDPFMQKEALDGVNEFLRLRAREDGFCRRILPPYTVTKADLTPQVDTNKPVIVKEMEPNSPGAYSVPFGKTPDDSYFDTPKYRIMFDRIMTHRFTADVMNLLTYNIDLREAFNDLMLKDILAEEDRKFISAVDTICSTVGNTTSARVTAVGAMGYVTVGALSRQALADAMKGLPSTNRKLSPACALVNNITVWDVVALDHDAIGGPGAEELFFKGFTERAIMGVNWFITNKTDLVATDEIYMFASPKYLGDFCLLEDVTVFTKHEAFMFEMFAYECIGGALKNVAAMAKASFTSTFGGWIPA